MTSRPVPADEVLEGDTITAQFKDDGDFFTITGTVRRTFSSETLSLGGWIVKEANGNPGPALFCITERTVAEPPVGTILKDNDGDHWCHVPDGWVCITDVSSAQMWKKISTEYILEPVTS